MSFRWLCPSVIVVEVAVKLVFEVVSARCRPRRAVGSTAATVIFDVVSLFQNVDQIVFATFVPATVFKPKRKFCLSMFHYTSINQLLAMTR